MKRRTRPLEPSEHRTVSGGVPLAVELLSDSNAKEYVLKWPEAALTQLILKEQAHLSQHRGSGSQSQRIEIPLVEKTASSPWSHPVPLTMTYVTPASMKSDFPARVPSFTLPDEWCSLLQQHHKGAWNTALRHAYETFVVDLEGLAAKHLKETSPAHRRVVTLFQKVRLSEIPENHATRGINREKIYDLWRAAREATRGDQGGREWGTPLVVEYNASEELDEYFIRTDQDLIAENRKEMNAVSRAKAVRRSSSAVGQKRARESSKAMGDVGGDSPLWFLNFDPALLMTKASTSTTKSTRRRSAKADSDSDSDDPDNLTNFELRRVRKRLETTFLSRDWDPSDASFSLPLHKMPSISNVELRNVDWAMGGQVTDEALRCQAYFADVAVPSVAGR